MDACISKTKICFKCNIEKSILEFYQLASMADGYLNKCKKCTIEDVKLRRIENPEKVHAYDRERAKTIKRVVYVRNHTIAWRKNNPEKYHAHNILNNAVRDGKIMKPIACEICGYVGPVHGHHTDYSKPLEVVWLCATCHGQIQ